MLNSPPTYLILRWALRLFFCGKHLGLSRSWSMRAVDSQSLHSFHLQKDKHDLITPAYTVVFCLLLSTMIFISVINFIFFCCWNLDLYKSWLHMHVFITLPCFSQSLPMTEAVSPEVTSCWRTVSVTDLSTTRTPPIPQLNVRLISEAWMFPWNYR